MSTLAPWKPSGSTGNSSAYGVISPAFQDIIACPPSSPVSLEDSMSDELRNYTYPGDSRTDHSVSDECTLPSDD